MSISTAPQPRPPRPIDPASIALPPTQPINIDMILAAQRAGLGEGIVMFDWNDLWGVIWSFFWIFAFVAYLIALVAVVADLFRDHTLSGGWKALWIVFLVFVPFLTVLVYLIARGRGMQERSEAQSRQVRESADDYIRSVAGHSPSDEISKARTLLANGAISEEEFRTLKAHALAS